MGESFEDACITDMPAKSKPYIVQYKYDLSSDFFWCTVYNGKRIWSGQKKKDWNSLEFNEKYKSHIVWEKKERCVPTYQTNNSGRLHRFHSENSLNIDYYNITVCNISKIFQLLYLFCITKVLHEFFSLNKCVKWLKICFFFWISL